MNERDRKVIIKITKVTKEQVEFRCRFEDSEYHIDDMPNCCLDLLNFSDVDDINQLLRTIGKAAYMQANRQDATEHLKTQPVSKLDINSLVGKEIPMSLGEIYE